jgi:hypothetical protein
LFQELSGLLEKRDELEEQEGLLIQSFNESGPSAEVQARKCFSGATIVFNEKELDIHKDMNGVRFYRDLEQDKILNS